MATADQQPDERAGGPGPKVRVLDHGPVREIRLNRPEVHNALDEELAAALTDAFLAVLAEAETGRIRAVLLTGSGKNFCAGADVHYMRRVGARTPEENREDARRLSAMFQAVRACPVYVVARVHGAALGGGSGLAACCNRVVASSDSRFGFTEVRLGIIPSVISPFVLERIGASAARTYFPTGEVFSAEEARRIGLVDSVVPREELDAAVQAVLQGALQAAPHASRVAKALIGRVAPGSLPLGSLPAELAALTDGESAVAADSDETESVFDLTARTIARMRSLPEGREGLAAFLEKRKPSWSEDYHPSEEV